MNHQKTLRTALNLCLGPKDKLIVIHSSLAHLNPPNGFSKWDILVVLRELINHGITIVVPAYTFGSCKGTNFNPKETPSEVGVLGNWVSKLTEFQRSDHPIYSHQIAGPLSTKLLKCKNTTTFGDDSIFSSFEKLNARFIMFGCDWRHCTYFHRFEEEANVPYREFKIFRCNLILKNHTKLQRVKMFVRNSHIDAENNFSSVINEIRSNNKEKTASLWKGNIYSAIASDLAQATRSILNKNLYGLVSNQEVIKYKQSIKTTKAIKPTYRVALLGHSNLSIIQSAFEEAIENSLDQRPEIVVTPYGQLAKEIFSPNTELYKNELDLVFFLDRLEDLIGVQFLHEAEPKKLSAAIDRYIETLYEFRKKSTCPMIIFAFPDLSFDIMGISQQKTFINSINLILEDTISKIPDAHLIDMSPVIANCSRVVDERLWSIGRFPYSKSFSNQLSKRLLGLTLAVSGRTTKLIAIDLDNTLWGGVLGDDGISNLMVGGDYPGNTFMAFQATLKQLAGRGIALAILSKNDAKHALNAIDSLPNMILRSKDFVSYRINWLTKADNLEQICAQLDLNAEHVLFIDDNPAEREQMRQKMPSVKVLDLPADTAYYSHALITCPWITTINITKEDKSRNQAYSSRAKVLKKKVSFSDEQDFFKSLESRLFFERLNDGNIKRAHQLINKTNQYNLTTKRYSLNQLKRIEQNGSSVIVIGAQDKFTAYENIGILIVNWNSATRKKITIDNYLLSCRFLGRGLELGPICWLANVAKKKNFNSIIGHIVRTERNQPCRELFREAKFRKIKTDEWRLDLLKPISKTPAWIKIIDRIPNGGI